MARRTNTKSKGKQRETSYDTKPFKGKQREYSAGSDKACNFDKLKSNDITWYNKNSIQFNLATKVPSWAQIQGRPYRAGSTLYLEDIDPLHEEFDPAVELDPNISMPGVMSLNFMPALGPCKSVTDPVNKAFSMLMSELYARTSGSSLNFQQADLAMMIVSLSSLAALFAHAKRALGTKDFWITRNINYPVTLYNAMGFSSADYRDMVENYNEYVSELQNLIAQFNAIKIPAWFDIFKRHYSLAHNVYLDEDSDFGQIYIFRPTGYWAYNDTDMTCNFVHKSMITFREVLDAIQECLTTWLNTSDLYTMNGALLRAFGSEGAFLFIEDFVPGTKIDPVVDRNIMLQVMNATIVNRRVEESATITQQPDKNTLELDLYIPGSNATIQKIPDGWLMRTFDDNPSPDDNMEMSRLTVTFEEVDGETHIASCGSELVTQLKVYRGPEDMHVITRNAYLIPNDNYPARDLIVPLGSISPFRYIPRITYVAYDYGNNRWNVTEVNDQYNYCAISSEDLIRLHDAAMYSLWKPQISSNRRG